MVDDEIDAGLIVTPIEDERIIERHLFYEPFYVYASPDHALSKRKNLRESDLDISSLWILEEGHCFRNQVLKVCSLDKSTSVLPNIEFTSGNLETLKNLVKKNSGFTLSPVLAALDLSSEESKMYLRKFIKPSPTREVSLVQSRSFLKENVIQALEDEILKNLPKKIKSLKRQGVEIIEVF